MQTWMQLMSVQAMCLVSISYKDDTIAKGKYKSEDFGRMHCLDWNILGLY